MCIRWLTNLSDSTKMHGATVRFIKFHINASSGGRIVMRTGGRTDRHDEANTAFRNFTNALEVHKTLRLADRISLCPQSKK